MSKIASVSISYMFTVFSIVVYTQLKMQTNLQCGKILKIVFSVDICDPSLVIFNQSCLDTDKD